MKSERLLQLNRIEYVHTIQIYGSDEIYSSSIDWKEKQKTTELIDDGADVLVSVACCAFGDCSLNT